MHVMAYVLGAKPLTFCRRHLSAAFGFKNSLKQCDALRSRRVWLYHLTSILPFVLPWSLVALLLRNNSSQPQLQSITMAATASITLGPHSDLKQSVANGRAEEYDIHADVGDILFTKQQLAEKTQQLGKVLGVEYADKRPLLMPILKGGFICECVDSSAEHGSSSAEPAQSERR